MTVRSWIVECGIAGIAGESSLLSRQHVRRFGIAFAKMKRSRPTPPERPRPRRTLFGLGVGLFLLGPLFGCTHERQASGPQTDEADREARASSLERPDRWAAAREALMNELEREGIKDPRVLAAMAAVPRHEMVEGLQEPLAYEDRPLPIGHGQTISQPYVVALMTELLRVEPGDKVLEIGTGSGYQAAVLAEVGARVYSMEIVEPLAKRATATLDRLGYGDRITVRLGDGYEGWPEEAPFDGIILTAAPPRIPAPLEEQLAMGGRLVAPVGEGIQELIVLERTPKGLKRTESIPVRFVPMTGRAQSE
ncbi:MAG: protein-L-isoaspartate(D-aspartate) O-methyltransferase [Myxococcota bacterium]